ncbi:MAG: site-specific integrase, partial [Eubacteriales bacterium]
MRVIEKQDIRRFVAHLEAEEKSVATRQKYLRDVLAFSGWLQGRVVDKETVLQYKEEITLHYAPASVNSMISSLNSFFVCLG